MAEDLYPDAGQEAPPGVQEEISNYRSLSPQKRQSTPLLYWLLGSGTPPYKADPEDAFYMNPSPYSAETCGNCIFAYQNVVDEDYICSQIRGNIEPKAWCEYWVGKEETE